MAIVLPQGFGGQSVGQALGTGLGQGLQTLAQYKFNDLAQRNQQAKASQFWQSLGLAPEISMGLAAQPEVVQKSILDRLEGLNVPTQGMAALAPQQGIEQLGQQLPQPTGAPARTGVTLGANPQERRHREQLALKEKALAQRERTEAYKQTKEERKEIIGKAKAARQNIHDLERMEELEKEGKLDTPGYAEFLKRSGLDIPALMNPGSEEFNKIAANFLRDAKTYFGSRISNFELDKFLATIPSLSQSPEGRKRVIANLKYFNRASLAYNDALKEILAENKGVPPLDLSEQIDDKIEKKLDVLSKKFKEDVARPVPQGQNRLVTALQSGLGNLAGSLPGALKGAGKGALIGAGIGKYGGPIGTAGGAAIGGLGGLLGVL